MVGVPVHDWRPGDRVASIAVSAAIHRTGLGTIQRVILDKAIVVWDDGKQSTERLMDLILAGHDPEKVILKAETVFNAGAFGQSQGDWWGDDIILSDIELELIQANNERNTLAQKERIAINKALITGLPLSTDTGIRWRS